MDFTRFLSTFKADVEASGPGSAWTRNDTLGLLGCEPAGYTEFLVQHARNSYGGGVLRILLADSKPSLRSWNAGGGWVDDWPSWGGRFIAFGYDWLGRQLGFDLHRRKGGEPLVGILEPGTAELLEVPTTFSEFLTAELVDYADAALATAFFDEWKNTGGAAPRMEQCVGYRTPLFLGGSDTVANLELCDLAVYVSLCGQMASQARDLPEGERIAGVKVDGGE